MQVAINAMNYRISGREAAMGLGRDLQNMAHVLGWIGNRFDYFETPIGSSTWFRPDWSDRVLLSC
jgi:hypothetical protein